MYSYFTDVSKVAEATSTLEAFQVNSRLIFTNRRSVLTSKMQFNKVNESLQVGGTIAQIQNKNQAVREEEKS